MGIALGLAVFAGVRDSVLDQEVQAILLAALFLAIGRLGTRVIRPFMLAAALGVAAGVVAGELRQSQGDAAPLFADPSMFSGRITSDPRAGGRGTFARFEWTDDSGRARQALLFLPAGVEAGRGDSVEVTGRFDSGGSDVIYADKARVTARADRIELVRRSVRAAISDRIQQATPGSAGTLALGLLIGDDSALTASERDELRRSGLSHITAVSGWNVTVVIGFVALALRALGRTGILWFSLQILSIAGYVWIVGAAPPIVRAAIMGGLALIAVAAGRPVHLLTLLVLSAAVMTAHDPSAPGSLSFQLSFLATLGLMVAGAVLERSETGPGKIFAVMSAPAAAALATAPLIAAGFGTLSLGTVPANLIVEPLVPPATFLGALTALVADVPLINVLVGTALWMICSAILEVARVIASQPGLSWTFAPLSPVSTVIVYLVLALAAAPAVPECRAALRDLIAWSEAQPRTAAITAVTAICAIPGGVLVLIPN